MDTKKLFKDIIYLILLFGISALLMFFYIYDENITAVFSFLILTGTITLINGFSLIAIRNKNIFYAVSAIICFILWLYPLYRKLQNLLPNNTGIWVYLLILTLFIPGIANCLYTILYYIIIELKEKKAGRKILTANKILSIISLVITAVSAAFLISAVIRLSTQIPKDIEIRKQSYSSAVNLAEEIALEYEKSDLMIEEILNKYEFTYDNSDEKIYIIEESDEVSIIINTSTDKNDNLSSTIIVSCDNIGFVIPNIYAKNFYDGESAVISLNNHAE